MTVVSFVQQESKKPLKRAPRHEENDANPVIDSSLRALVVSSLYPVTPVLMCLMRWPP